jgi:hypothetical protein
MKPRSRTDLIVPIALSVCGLAAGVWMMFRAFESMNAGNDRDKRSVARLDRSGTKDPPPSADPISAATSPDLSNALLDALKEEIERPHALANEALLTFSDPAALAGFVANATAAGLVVTGPFAGADTIRVSFDSLGQLRDVLAAHRGKAPAVSANFRVGIPDLSVPPPAGGTGTAPFEASLLPSLGIDAGSDRRSWGEDITVAVIDSGISPHPAFREGQITHLDLTSERGAFHAHGTAMASLIAGGYPGAEGVAPGAELLDLRIAGKKGLSDSFLLAEGIRTAMERGADVINISMATYGDAAPVADAVAEAIRRGITVVAAVGNEGAGMKAWPAAYPDVISVSGVAADDRLAYFSNTGEPTLAAPSVGVPSAYSDGKAPMLAIGNGTSQAAALVSGAAAVFRSRGLDAPSALVRHARPGSAGKDEIGAGILFLPPLDPVPPANR